MLENDISWLIAAFLGSAVTPKGFLEVCNPAFFLTVIYRGEQNSWRSPVDSQEWVWVSVPELQKQRGRMCLGKGQGLQVAVCSPCLGLSCSRLFSPAASSSTALVCPVELLRCEKTLLLFFLPSFKKMFYSGFKTSSRKLQNASF